MTTETPITRLKLYAERQRAYPRIADFMSDLRALVAGHEAKDAALQTAAQRFREDEASHRGQAQHEHTAGHIGSSKDRLAKADRNRDMAELCEKALGL